MNKKPLWNKNFILLLQGNMVSRIGDVIYLIAVNYWIYEKTGSTAAVGIYSSLIMLPGIILGVMIGAMVDVMNRKQLIVGMDIARGCIMLLVAILAYFQLLSLPILYFLGFLTAVCSMFFDPAVISVVPVLVEPEDLMQANAVTSGAKTGIDIIGKAISGVLLSIFGLLGSVLINAVSYLLSAFSEQFIAIPSFTREQEQLSLKQVMEDTKYAFGYFFKDRPLLAFLTSALLANLLMGGFFSMLWPYAKSMGLTITQFGYWMSILAIIDLLAMALLGIFKIPVKYRPIAFRLSCIISGFAYLIALSSTNIILIAIFMGIGSFFNVVLNMLVLNVFMLLIPQNRKGAMIGVIIMLTQVGSMLSVLGYGYLGEVFTIRLIALFGHVAGVFPMLWLSFSKAFAGHLSTDKLTD